MLKRLDKILTKLIDWLYLKRTVLRLKIAVETGGTYKYHYPPRPETINRRLNEFGLSVKQLNSASAMSRPHNIDAMMQG